MSKDEIITVLPSYVGRHCLFIERPTMSIAEVVSVSIDDAMFRVSFAAVVSTPICSIDDDYTFRNEPATPHGENWEVSLNLNDFNFDPEYWDGSRYMGWRVIFDPDVVKQFLLLDLSWKDDWF